MDEQKKEQLGRFAANLRRRVKFRLDDDSLEVRLAFAGQPAPGERARPQNREVSSTLRRDDWLFFIDSDHDGVVVRLHHSR
ncbi:MAG: hypothetical protein M3450_08085, partial [Actinomycetota bacterium]|nr:hypothetical protein [Actinomycetota bacterium]